jgi:hypothetical protein
MIIAGIAVGTPLYIVIVSISIYHFIIIILDMLSTAVVVEILLRSYNELLIWLILAVEENMFCTVV